MLNSDRDSRRSLRNASRWGIGLGILMLLVGALSLERYLSTGAVYIHRERTTLSGRGALTWPIGWLGGGVAFLAFGVHYRIGLRKLSGR